MYCEEREEECEGGGGEVVGSNESIHNETVMKGACAVELVALGIGVL